jgi:hypothetical protein
VKTQPAGQTCSVANASGTIGTANVTNANVTCTTSTYTVTATSGGNGKITPASQTVNSGSTASFTVTPNAGYRVASVTSNTCTVSQVGTSTTWTSSAITQNCAVTATFAITANTNYIVTSSAGMGGSVSPGSVTVLSGQTTRFTIVPGIGFSIYKVTDDCGSDDSSIGTLSGTSYTTGPTNANCSVSVTFATATTVGVVLSDKKVVGAGNASATFSVTSNVAAASYWLVQPASAAAPTVGQIANGNSGTMSAGMPFSRTLTGLSANTSYVLYFVGWANGGFSPLWISKPFTTAPP